MTEQDYIKVTNRVTISIALATLASVLPGENYGITNEELLDIKRRLSVAETNLFDSIKIEAN